MLHWVVQNNMYNERGYAVLLETIERFGLEHTYVKVVPFSHELMNSETEELIPVESLPNRSIIVGSISLGKIAHDAGWTPGAFLNSNFDYRVWSEKYGEHCLNADATVCTFGSVWWPLHEVRFIRPCLDDKTFAGRAMSGSSFQIWKKKVVKLRETYTTLDEHTPVLFGEPKEIYQEYRFFVVQGKVVTGSLYKIGTRVHSSPEIPPVVQEFAEQMIGIWQPADAFCIDIAATSEGARVIEIGCITSCGFYASDIQKLVLTINEAYS